MKNTLQQISLFIGLRFTECTSSNLKGYAYDNNDEKLYILFKGDKLYGYPNIPYELYKELDTSESKGMWVNKNLVKTHRPYTKQEF